MALKITRLLLEYRQNINIIYFMFNLILISWAVARMPGRPRLKCWRLRILWVILALFVVTLRVQSKCSRKVLRF